MLRIEQDSTRVCDGYTRRELLLAGGLMLGGLNLTHLPPAAAAGRARSCILLYMFGGPPGHETWDPKPETDTDVRGPFGAIPSSLNGLQTGELMPLLARQAHRCSVLRGMATDINAHTGSGYWMLTGRPHVNRFGESIPPAATDWPTLGSIVNRFLPPTPHLPASVALPEQLKNNPGIVVAGQTGGFLGPAFEPLTLDCRPEEPGFRVETLSPPAGVNALRFRRRLDLLHQVNEVLDSAHRGLGFEREDAARMRALDMLSSSAARRAFDLSVEPAPLRERYGSHRFGQSCLLARRLVESGVRLVSVNWPRDGDNFDMGNPVWDTHSDHINRMRLLMPKMDQGVSALLQDLDDRGMLDETLVIWMGEFGRTPKFNPVGGKDHWGHAFPVMLAGGGVKRGMVYGATDSIGAYPVEGRVEPPQLHATILHLLGISPEAEIRDQLNRPQAVAEAAPLREILA